MKIEIIETTQGSLDGETVQKLVKGHQYETVDSPRGERLAAYHVDMGYAIYAKDKPAPPPALELELAEKVAASKGRK